MMHPISLNIHTFLPTLFLIIVSYISTVKGSDSVHSNFAHSWNTVDTLISSGLNQTALDTTIQLYSVAKSTDNVEQMVKALIYRMRLESYKEEDAFVKAVQRLKKEAAEAPFPASSMLYSMLGECYWFYYKNNRYRFYQRTQTRDIDRNDIHTWDLRTIMERMTAAYLISLKNADKLKKITLDSFGKIIIRHRLDTTLRPTLYDLLIHRAIDYFSIDDNELTKPAFEFTLNSTDYFLPAAEFVRYRITTRDSASLKLHALRLLQECIGFHLSDNSPEALIDADLKRLAFVRQRSTLENRDSLYLAALKALKHRFRRHPSSSEISYRIAELYHTWGQTWKPRVNDRYRWMNRKSLVVCDSVIEAYPQSYGAQQCRSLVDRILTKEMHFSIEAINLPDKPFKALLRYSNIGKVYWRQLSLPVAKYNELIKDKREEEIAAILNKIKPIKKWETALPDPHDYQSHSVEVLIPALSLGHYVILCSTDPKFGCEEQAFSWAATQITRIGFISRRLSVGGNEFHLLDRETGTPLSEVKITAWTDKYNSMKREYERVKYGTYTSDGEGSFIIPAQKGASLSCSIVCTKGKDRYDSDNRFHLYKYGTRHRTKRLRTYFFTDRSIYRPGQTVYFKGIMLFTDGQTSEIAAGEKTKVTFYNVNGQEAAHLELTSNSYGSIHGSFVTPTSALNGTMSISNTHGTSYFSVEEYKRPKFSVSIFPFQETKKVGDSLKVTGHALAYSGSPIDGAEVTYRIVRTTRLPNYWWNRWRPPYRMSEAVIGNGVTTTNDTGGFSIDFIALADKSIPEKENPFFSYSISADVTDITGETQSTGTTVSVGYTPLTFTLDIARHISNSQPLAIPVITSNSNGIFQPAKGTITVYKLSSPTTVYRTRYWEMPDTAVLTETAFRKAFPHDIYDNETDVTTWKKDKRVFKSTFNTAQEQALIIKNSKNWKPGVYVAEGKVSDKSGDSVTDTRYFTLYSEKNGKLPSPQPDWFIPVKTEGEPGEKAKFIIGTAYKNAVLLYEIEHAKKIVRKKWLPLQNEQKLIEVPIKEKYRGNFVLHFSFIHNNRTYLNSATVSVPWTNKELAISFETFRDKLTPGEKEQWKLKISGSKKDAVTAEMVATLYDASLDAFKPHGWSFSIFPWYYSQLAWKSDDGFRTLSSLMCAHHWNSFTTSPSRDYPMLNWFGYEFQESYYYRHRMGNRMMMPTEMAAMPPPAPAPKRALHKSLSAAATLGDAEFSENADKPHAKKGEISADTAIHPQSVQTPTSPLQNIAARTNLNETAFFFPELTTNKNGEIIINFQIPEALTRWNMIGFAHTKDLSFGQISNSLVTQKELMVVPHCPRFFRENDRITFTAKVSNLSKNDLKGTASLYLFNAATMQPLNKQFKHSATEKKFSVKKGRSVPLAWNLSVPEGIGAVTCKVVAKAGNFSDGEEQIVPVLSNRMLLTESVPLSIRKKGSKTFTLKNLVSQNGGSSTLRNERVTLEFTTNPAWYAIQALPYLMEFPHECAEQLFSRFYANSLASHIVTSSPHIKTVFDQWRTLTPDALLSNLEKNQSLKALALEETPWLLDGKNESERKQRIALLFDLNKMADQKDRALQRLQKMQLSNGGWPWFEGMPDDRYITQYITIGLGRLDHLGVINLSKNKKLLTMVKKSVHFLDKRISEDYKRIVKHGHPEQDNLTELYIQYLYMRSFFGQIALANGCEEAFKYFTGQTKKFWLKKRRYMQGMIALALHRTDEKTVSAKIVRSLKENALVSEEMGMYWKEMYEGGSWWWYTAPIETEALMIEVFEEIANDTVSVESLKTWLLKSKQTQNWPTTRATAEACYALFLKGIDWLNKQPHIAIKLGDKTIIPSQRKDIRSEAGTGYFKIAWTGDSISPTMGKITVTKQENGVAWGALYWQYFEQLDKIKTHATPLKLSKKLFLQQESPTGTKITPVTKKTSLKPGNKLTVRIELRVDRDIDYVHMKDMRASGFEPVNVLSAYRWQDGLGYYESTRDAATHFFFSSLKKGTYVFEYPLVVSHSGNFSNGITTIQCMYAPEFTSHSEGVQVKVGE